MSQQYHSVIGIDLGTTYSAVATHDTFQGQAMILEDNGKASTPSVIGLDETGEKVIVGAVAKDNLLVDPLNTVIEIKREMGETFTKATAAKHGASEADVGKPVRVTFKGQKFLPQELSAFILMRMKEIAEKGIGDEVRDAVITVPAYFTEEQKKATEEAALLAGLYPRQLIPEPTAAAICFGLDQLSTEKNIYLVYDLGGGTFDVSIIEVAGESVSVLATSGDPRLGGGDFDDEITAWAVEVLAAEHGIDVRITDALLRDRSPAALEDLERRKKAQAFIKSHAEKAKIDLSSLKTVSMSLLQLQHLAPDGKTPVLTLTREVFEQRIEGWLKKSLSYVDKAISLAGDKGVQRDQIDAILLVGGSSQIPIIKSQLLGTFGKDDSFIRADLDPATVVARGAAVLARRFQATPPPFDISKHGQSNELNPDMDPEELKLTLIAEHSLGVGVQGNRISHIIRAGTNLPIEVEEGGYTNAGPTDTIPVHIYQGEGETTYQNTHIGTLYIEGLEPKPEGHHQFLVKFKLDVNGLLTATVFHKNTNRSFEARFDHSTGVGSVSALAESRKRLVSLFASSVAAIPVLPPGMHTPQVPGGMPVPQVGGPGQYTPPAPPSGTSSWPPGPPVAGSPGSAPPPAGPPGGAPPWGGAPTGGPPVGAPPGPTPGPHPWSPPAPTGAPAPGTPASPGAPVPEPPGSPVGPGVSPPGGEPGQEQPETPVHPDQPQGQPVQPQGYPGQPQGHPGQPQGYPGQPQGHPGQPQGYPPQQQGYPPQQQGYPPQQQGYPPQQQGYPPQEQGYPPQQGQPGPQQPEGVPSEEGEAPAAESGHASAPQHGHAPVYPSQQPGYPPQPHAGGYPGHGAPPPGAGYPPQGGGYPPQGGYPQPGAGHPAVGGPGGQAAPGQPTTASAWGTVPLRVEPPEQARALVRRAEKLLIKAPNPPLLQAYNAYVSALNGGAWQQEVDRLYALLEQAFRNAAQ